MLVAEIARFGAEDGPLSSPVLDLETIVLVDQLPDELRRHCGKLDRSTKEDELYAIKRLQPASRGSMYDRVLTSASFRAAEIIWARGRFSKASVSPA